MKGNARYYVAILLLLAFVLRLGAAAYWHRLAQSEGRLFRLGDSHSYWTLASQLGAGLPYEYGSSESRIFRAPLYPMLLAPLTRLSGPTAAVWWARVAGCLLGTLSVGLVVLLARRLGGMCAAVVTAALAAAYPSAIGMSIVVLSESLFMPLMVGYLLLWQSAWSASQRSQTLLYALLAGGVAGAAVLTRPSWLLFVPFVFGLGVFFSRHRGRHVAVFVATLLGLSVVMAPWWIRSALITGHFVPTTLQVGPSLYDGLHAGATGASDEGMAFMADIIARQERDDAQSTQSLASTLEYRINDRAQREALAWAWENPLEVLRLAARKFSRIWSLWPDGGDLGSTPVRLAISLSCFTVLLLALHYAAWMIRTNTWFSFICWCPCIYFTLLHMVFVGSVRYREPAMFVLLALAGSAMARLFRCRDLGSAPESSEPKPGIPKPGIPRSGNPESTVLEPKAGRVHGSAAVSHE